MIRNIHIDRRNTHFKTQKAGHNLYRPKKKKIVLNCDLKK